MGLMTEYYAAFRELCRAPSAGAAAESERRFSYALGCLLDGLEARRPGGRSTA
jgi:hypothetical protein